MPHRQPGTILLAVALALGVNAYAGEKDASKKQTTCPVMGGKINKAQYVDVNGYRIYVCCPGCKGRIEADPGKYIRQMKDEGVTPERAPEKENAAGERRSDADSHSGHQH